MAQVAGPSEHLRQCRNGLDLHRRTGAPPIESMIVGIDRHCQRISSTRDRMWRLQHLPGIERMAVRIVILHLHRHFVEDGSTSLAELRYRNCWKVSEVHIETL